MFHKRYEYTTTQQALTDGVIAAALETGDDIFLFMVLNDGTAQGDVKPSDTHWIVTSDFNLNKPAVLFARIHTALDPEDNTYKTHIEDLLGEGIDEHEHDYHQ